MKKSLNVCENKSKNKIVSLKLDFISNVSVKKIPQECFEVLM